MTKKLYAIIDIETTGGKATREKITEIAIVIHDGEKVVNTFESLINPEKKIPYNITRITGIDDKMVADAPKFYEVAQQVVKMTEGAIFVAHNVRFDYSFIREEFKRLGYTYTRKQLCTVRMSRKAFPGLASYSLGNLIKHFGIKVNARHRAMADTMATVELFEKILLKEGSRDNLTSMLNLGVKEALLPKNISLERLHELPESCGVYYLHDIYGDIVYIGKSINIKKRVMEHFAKITEKASKLQKLVNDVSYEETGSELIALLYESQLIKELNPSVNRAQRQKHFPYMIYTYTDEKGYICFDVIKNTKKNRLDFEMISEYPTLMRAKGTIKLAWRKYELCSHYCNIEAYNRPCFDYHLKQCEGACIYEESPEAYNVRAEEAKEALSTVFQEDFFILDKGRNLDEQAVVFVEDGVCRGFGYIEKSEMNGNIDCLRDAIKPYPSFPETSRIIQRFLNDNKNLQIIKN